MKQHTPTTAFSDELGQILNELKTKAADARASCTARKNWEDYGFKYAKLEVEAKQQILAAVEKIMLEVIPDERPDPVGENPLSSASFKRVGYNTAIQETRQRLQTKLYGDKQ